MPLCLGQGQNARGSDQRFLAVTAWPHADAAAGAADVLVLAASSDARLQLLILQARVPQPFNQQMLATSSASVRLDCSACSVKLCCQQAVARQLQMCRAPCCAVLID